MVTGIAQTTLLVREYDEAKDFYCGKLGFVFVEDTLLSSGKRWVRLRSAGQLGSEILLSRVTDEEQQSVVGNPAGGRALFFFDTDDFAGDYARLASAGA